MASQIQPCWEREVKDNLATLHPPLLPLQQLLVAPPHRPSTSLTRQTREGGSQQGLTHTQFGDEGGEQGLALPCLHTHLLH
jgi:hypothetical protein